jgi:hypothetical protein
VAIPEYRREDNEEGSGGGQIEVARPEKASGSNDGRCGASPEKPGQRSQNVSSTTEPVIRITVTEESK